MRRFAPGESVVWRSVDRDTRTVTTVWPWTVVRDDPAGIALYMPVATVGTHRTGRRGGPRDRMLLEWDGGYAEKTWHTREVIRLYQEGDAFSIWIARDPVTLAVAWRYVNLEAPWLRTPLGFDSRDHWLDLYDEDDDVWRWKDEDELAWLVEQGRVDEAFARRVRADGEEAVRRIQSGATLLREPWGRWRPDPAWRMPALPARWREYDPAL